MTANGVGMSGTMTPVHVGFPRVNSALSHVSYPAAYASPVVQLPRAYSYTSVQPGWSNQQGEVVYTPIEGNSHSGSVKGKEVERVMIDSGRASRTSSKGSFGPYPVETSPTNGRSSNSPSGSSGNSTSSQDDLEMKPVKHTSAAQHSATPNSSSSSPAHTPSHIRPAGEVDYFHRLHPSHPRRISDPSSPPQQYVSQPTSRTSYVPQKQGGPRVTSLPATSSGIPPVPALPAMQFGAPLTHSAHTSSVASISSEASSVTIVPNSSFIGRGSPPREPIPEEVAGPISAKEVDTYLPEIGTAYNYATSTPVMTQNKRRLSKTTRFSELETISSHVSEHIPRSALPAPVKPEVRTTITATYALPTMFDEAALAQTQAPVLPVQQTKGKGRLSKNPTAKLAKKEVSVKKNRWSLRSSKPAEVAV